MTTTAIRLTAAERREAVLDAAMAEFATHGAAAGRWTTPPSGVKPAGCWPSAGNPAGFSRR